MVHVETSCDLGFVIDRKLFTEILKGESWQGNFSFGVNQCKQNFGVFVKFYEFLNIDFFSKAVFT